MLKRALNKIFPTAQAKRVKPWFHANGDKTLRLNYPLKNDSVVFDLGGYEGQWASDIYGKYDANILVFEPFLPYAKNISERFSMNKKIKVFNFGLGKQDQTLHLFSDNDATSTYRGKGEPHPIIIKRASSFMAENKIYYINLMKINIEGGEYDLLEDLIENNFIQHVENIQVQFHDFVPHAKERMNLIQQKLSATHDLTYQFEFVWENWRLKPPH